jgi:hypothetical protein
MRRAGRLRPSFRRISIPAVGIAGPRLEPPVVGEEHEALAVVVETTAG